jgi:hypothetical protein
VTVIGARSSFRKRGEMSPHKRPCVDWCGQLPGAAILPWIILTFPFPNTLGWVPPHCSKPREQSKARRSCRTYCVSHEATFRVPLPGAGHTSKRMISWPPTLESILPVRRAVNSQKLFLPDTPHSSARPLNFLWYAVTTYIPLKHLSLAAPLSAWNHWWPCDSTSFP